MTTPHDQPRDPLHGITLERMLNELVEHFGWEAMAQRIPIRCFTSEPSITSSLKFLRKTPWAREKVESMYLFMLREQARMARASAKRPPLSS
ncbi:MAG TPA: VF530 family protein [Abditibacteriaceae bacterium]